MRIRFPIEDLLILSRQYSYARAEAELISLRGLVRDQGFLTLAQLQVLANWKSPRSAGNIQKNSEGFVREVTSFALNAKDERSRIECLTILNGVRWPTASVVLHLFHKEPYPIIDYRALWSVGAMQPSVYSFAFWWQYVEFCRSVASLTKVDMRTLDRALWQYSKENQPSLTT